MSKYTQRLLSMLALLASSAQLQAIDIFQFYRPPFFMGAPRQDQRDATSFFDVRYGHGKTDTAWDRDGNRVGILSQYGRTNVSLLASNVAGVTEECTPLTYRYLDPKSGIIPGYKFTGCDGNIALSGAFDIEEFDFTWQQNLRFGFYAMAYLPFRDIKVNNIVIENFTHPENPNAQAFSEFLCCGTFDRVLCENGYEPATTPFIESGISDGAFYLGWQGYDDHAIDLFRDIAGFVQIGAIVPFASRSNPGLLSAVPLGYNDHWAASTRFALEIGFADHFALGVNGAVDIIWNEDRCARIKTDLCQEGIIYFGREKIELQPGLVWNGGIYFHFDQPIKGLHFIGGYSYSKQDRARLKEVMCYQLPVATPRPGPCQCASIDSEQTGCTICCPFVPLTKQDTITTDQRLRTWEYHTIHLRATFDGHDYYDYAPHVTFEYDWPLAGNRSFTTKMIGGTAGLTLSWGF